MYINIFFFLFLIALLTLIFSYKRNFETNKYLKGIPGPKPVPIFGNTLDFLTSSTSKYAVLILKEIGREQIYFLLNYFWVPKIKCSPIFRISIKINGIPPGTWRNSSSPRETFWSSSYGDRLQTNRTYSVFDQDTEKVLPLWIFTQLVRHGFADKHW